MNLDTTVTCPECDADYTLRDVAVWHVCLTCGQIWPPGEQWNCHRRDDSVDCDGVHAIRKYSEEEALEQQREVRS